jgi:hypothetical protein
MLHATLFPQHTIQDRKNEVLCVCVYIYVYIDDFRISETLYTVCDVVHMC